jgi:hypothetical protein
MAFEGNQFTKSKTKGKGNEAVDCNALCTKREPLRVVNREKIVGAPYDIFWAFFEP